jgi:hypothetical protein
MPDLKRETFDDAWDSGLLRLWYISSGCSIGITPQSLRVVNASRAVRERVTEEMTARTLAIAAVLMAGTAVAAEIYVSPNGNDSNPGISSSSTTFSIP